MPINFSSPYFSRTALFVIFAELVSLFGVVYPEYRIAGFIVVTALTLFVTLERLEWGILMLIAELVIGSKGYLFALPIAGTDIPIRIALWCIILAVWITRIRSWWPDVRAWHREPAVRALGALLLFVGIGALRGWRAGYALNHFFLDVNAWFFFALAGPIITTYRNPAAWGRLLHVISAAALVSALKVLSILFIFTHDPFGAAAPTIYRWVRITGVGEMARLGGGLYRIFFQSQLWALTTFFFAMSAFCGAVTRRQRFALLVVASCMLASLILSFSRSLWVAGSVGVLVLSALVGLMHGWRSLKSLLVHGGVSVVLAVLFIYGTIYFPYPRFRVPVDFTLALEERVKTDDVAVASRWHLLPRLWDRITAHWLFGSGFGATVTYRSSDPRIVQQSATGNSVYTTYVFEWGYLDLWLKLGLLGLGAYGALLLVVVLRCLARARAGSVLASWVLTSIVAVAVTHLFTPYLNHPLGIGFLLLAIAYTLTPISDNENTMI